MTILTYLSSELRSSKQTRAIEQSKQTESLVDCSSKDVRRGFVWNIAKSIIIQNVHITSKGHADILAATIMPYRHSGWTSPCMGMVLISS